MQCNPFAAALVPVPPENAILAVGRLAFNQYDVHNRVTARNDAKDASGEIFLHYYKALWTELCRG